MRRLLLGACVGFLAACLSEAAREDPVKNCSSCAGEHCTAYFDACMADDDCSDCFARPKSLLCLANTMFHAAAHCSCDGCAPECTYMCPGGQGACDSCSASACKVEGDACLADVECAPCLEDPFLPECAANAAFMASKACSCESCGQECIWTCPAAGNECAACISSSCPEQFDACLTDASCMDCFENPATAGCAEHATYGELRSCLCAPAACEALCDVLFCGPV